MLVILVTQQLSSFVTIATYREDEDQFVSCLPVTRRLESIQVPKRRAYYIHSKQWVTFNTVALYLIIHCHRPSEDECGNMRVYGNWVKLWSRNPSSGPIFEPGSSIKQKSSDNLSTLTFSLTEKSFQ
jgi:hypothetical protein